MSSSDEILRSIRGSVSGLAISGKVGKSLLQPAIANGLGQSGFEVDVEDKAGLLPGGLPVWRSKDDGTVVPTKGRRRLDIVVYHDQKPVALIETESDLNDLRVAGVTRRNSHYDVASIARHADGGHFDSYNSIERMACAAFYWHMRSHLGCYPSPEQAVAMLEEIEADDPYVHNPAGLALVLVGGCCRPQDEGIIARRLRSLSATLMCARGAR